MSQITLDWSISEMTRDVSSGYVLKVRWACNASAPGVSGAKDGDVFSYTFNPGEPGFIPFEQLTEQIVLGWVFASLGEQKEEIEAKLTAKVQKQLTPTTEIGFPSSWMPTPGADEPAPQIDE